MKTCECKQRGGSGGSSGGGGGSSSAVRGGSGSGRAAGACGGLAFGIVHFLEQIVPRAIRSRAVAGCAAHEQRSDEDDGWQGERTHSRGAQPDKSS